MSESDFKWFIGRAALIAVVALSCWLFGHHLLGLVLGLMGASWLFGYTTGRAEESTKAKREQEPKK